MRVLRHGNFAFSEIIGPSTDGVEVFVLRCKNREVNIFAEKLSENCSVFGWTEQFSKGQGEVTV